MVKSKNRSNITYNKAILKIIAVLIILSSTFPFSNDTVIAKNKNVDKDLWEFPGSLYATIEQNKLTLADAIKMSLINNPQVVIEKASIEEKEWSIKEQKSYLYPHLYVNQSFMASNNPVNAFMTKLSQRDFNLSTSNLNYPGTKSNFSTRIGADFILFDRSLYKQVSISKLEMEIQKQLGKKSINELIQAVRKAYLDVQLAQQKINNDQTTLELANSYFKAVSNKKEAGSASKSEFLSAKAKVAEAEENLLKSKNDLNLSWIILSDIVGDETIVGLDLVDNLKEDFSIGEIDKLVKYAYSERPDIQAAEKNNKKAFLEIKLAKATSSMNIKAQGEWGVDTILDRDNIAKSYTTFVSLNKPIFDGGLRKAKINKALANSDKRRAEVTQTYNKVKIEVIQNYLSFKNAQERLNVTKHILDDAHESLRTYHERYLVGLSTNVEMENAQSKLANAKYLRTYALYDLNLSFINLQKAIGISLNDILEGTNTLCSDKPDKKTGQDQNPDKTSP